MSYYSLAESVDNVQCLWLQGRVNGLVLHLFVPFIFIHLADAFIQSKLQMS